MNKIFICISFVGILCFFSCNNTTSQQEEQQQQTTVDRYKHITDTKAREIIKRSIEHAGGIELWEKMKSLSYTKNFSLLLENGATEKAYEQVHNYTYHPTKIDILSIENGDTIHTTYADNQYARTVNDAVANVSQEALAKAVNTSTYVVGMPFKLLDPGAIISYLGIDTLAEGQVVDVIQVSYNADEHDNHSTTDTWKYYFDQTDGKILANWVQTSDHFSMVENLTFERVEGILFNKIRKSYRVDSLNNRLFLRADYDYGNYVVSF